MNERPLDLICLGRAAVDLYGEQIGSTLERMQSFAKYLGGCAANVAVGAARQGLKVAMLTRVGDEHMGRFVREALAGEGIDVSHVRTDPTRLTGLVLLGIRDRQNFPLIFFRESCADMGVELADVDPPFVASARALLVTGTHFSTPQVDAASRAAMRAAHEARTRVVFDIDYRPVLWGLTGHGLGEERFVASERVTAHLQSIVAGCDLVVGTEEEMHIAGGSTDTLEALAALRALTPATLVLKRGAAGAVVFEGPVASLEDGVAHAGFTVEVLNVLGAGDAFLAGFLRGWIAGEPALRCATYANGCGAMVVARHGCSPAMPSRVELDAFLSRPIVRVGEDARLSHLHRLASRRKRDELYLCALEEGGLGQILEQVGAEPSTRRRIEMLLAEGVAAGAERARVDGGLIVGERCGADMLFAASGRGLLVARGVEPTTLRASCGADLGLVIRAWPGEQVVHCRVRRAPDEGAAQLAEQTAILAALARACSATGHELLLELLPQAGEAAPVLLESLYEQGVEPEWWGLEPQPDAPAWQKITEVVERRDPSCRGVLLLRGRRESLELQAAVAVGLCRGFVVDATSFGRPLMEWLRGRVCDEELRDEVGRGFAEVIESWRRLRDEARERR